MEIKAKSFILSTRLKKTCWILFIVSLLGLALSTYLALRFNTTMPATERKIFDYINHMSDSLKTFALVITTLLGSVWAFVGVSVIVTACKAYRLAWWLSVSVFITYGIVFVAKILVDRARPSGLVNDAVVRAVESSNGFPSGHTALATVLSLTLFFYLSKGWRWVIVIAWVMSVAWTRLYLGVHSPLDILGGIAIGALVFTGLRLLPSKLKCMLRLLDTTKPKAS